MKRAFIISAIIGAALLLSLLGYRLFWAPTHIALVNFPPYMVSNLVLSNNDKHIKISEIAPEDAQKLSEYEIILLFGAGFRPTELQQQEIARAEKKGRAIYSTVFNSETVRSGNISEEQQARLDKYYSNPTRSNFRNMLLYLRETFDARKIAITPSVEPVILPSDIYYHLAEGAYFTTHTDLTAHLKKEGLYHEGAHRIALVSGVTFPMEGNRAHIDSLITAFTHKGYNVYPLSSGEKRLELLQTLAPEAIIYLPMGRFTNDEGVAQLQRTNTLLFAPLPISKSQEEWRVDPQGVSGGTLTARIVLPEIDGAIAPMVVSTQQTQGTLGLQVHQPEPERMQHFVEYVSRYIALRTLPNRDKKVGIIYFRGAGQQSLFATGLEVAPSLYALLRRMRSEGYDLTGLPDTYAAFVTQLNRQGVVWAPHSKGAMQELMRNGDPAIVPVKSYEAWAKETFSPERWAEIERAHGKAPGEYLATNDALAVASLRYGNVTLVPQPRAGLGGDDFKMVHGTGAPPPHAYIAAYLWLQYEQKVDLLLHFGTHGSLEFTQGKQAALSHDDWADRLMGNVPSLYYYAISNVGEGIIAKRRLHATLTSYLTPPFMESRTRSQYKELFDRLEVWRQAGEEQSDRAAKAVQEQVVALGMHRDLQLSGDLSRPYTTQEIETIEAFAEEIAQEKMTGRLYTLGTPYTPHDILETVLAITADPLAHALAQCDVARGHISREQFESNAYIVKHYLPKAKQFVRSTLDRGGADISTLATLAKLSAQEMEAATRSTETPTQQKMMDKTRGKKTQKEKPSEITLAIQLLHSTATQIIRYKQLLEESPEQELQALLTVMNGGYIAPSPGGDLVRSPNTLPTGRNLFSINAENTPTETAWNTGVALAKATLERYKSKHGNWPQKVSHTFWAGEFIESEGATIAQVLYMLGVEPVRDRMGRVTDLKLISSSELQRPRIDVVVQTSGQLRDLAASRLALITRAVEMAAGSQDSIPNFVHDGVVHTEKRLVEEGSTPQMARKLSTMRVFGGLNGTYGTGIKEFIEKGDAWGSQADIASVYTQNMSAIYGSEEEWGLHVQNIFAINLEHTDVIVQPRQNNTWGALSLDHMYEFMGGINASIESVTGKAPETYLADYRNRNRRRLQELKEAIGVESRTTILNPEYIKEKMQGGASSAGTFAKTLRNTFGWSATKSDAIAPEMWQEIYETYVDDKHRLGVNDFFERENPYALQEMTAVMIESGRKGFWSPSDQQLAQLTQRYAQLVEKYGASGSEFAESNTALQQYIAQKLPQQQAAQLKAQLDKATTPSEDGIVLSKQQLTHNSVMTTSNLVWIAIAVGALALIFLFVIIRRRAQNNI